MRSGWASGVLGAGLMVLGIWKAVPAAAGLEAVEGQGVPVAGPQLEAVEGQGVPVAGARLEAVEGQGVPVAGPQLEAVEGKVTAVGAESVTIDAGPDATGARVDARRFRIAPVLARQLRNGDRIRAGLSVDPDGAVRIESVRFLVRAPAALEPVPDNGALPIGSVLPARTIPGIDGAILLGASQGTPTVLTFLFRSCAVPGACPLLAHKLGLLQKEIRGQGRIVTLTLDPERDTLPALRDFAAAHDADPGTWMIGRLELSALEPLLRQVGVFRVERDAQLFHSLQVVLLDARGRIAWRSDGNAWDVKALADRLRALSSEARRSPPL